MIIEFLILVLTVALLADYAVKKRRNDIVKDLPGPDTLPIFGNALMYYGKSLESIMGFIQANREKYGPLYRVWIFNQLAIFSSDPRDVEVVLSSQKLITKNRLYDLLLPWLGTGLLMSTDKKWHSRRKIITPTFHFTILEQFVEVFNQQGDIMIEKLKAKADGKTVINIQPDICLAALDIIAGKKFIIFANNLIRKMLIIVIFLSQKLQWGQRSMPKQTQIVNTQGLSMSMFRFIYFIIFIILIIRNFFIFDFIEKKEIANSLF